MTQMKKPLVERVLSASEKLSSEDLYQVIQHAQALIADRSAGDPDRLFAAAFAEGFVGGEAANSRSPIPLGHGVFALCQKIRHSNKACTSHNCSFWTFREALSDTEDVWSWEAEGPYVLEEGGQSRSEAPARLSVVLFHAVPGMVCTNYTRRGTTKDGKMQHAASQPPTAYMVESVEDGKVRFKTLKSTDIRRLPVPKNEGDY